MKQGRERQRGGGEGSMPDDRGIALEKKRFFT